MSLFIFKTLLQTIKISIFLLSKEMLNQRNQIIKDVLNLSDITTLIVNYDYFFFGKCIKTSDQKFKYAHKNINTLSNGNIISSSKNIIMIHNSDLAVIKVIENKSFVNLIRIFKDEDVFFCLINGDINKIDIHTYAYELISKDCEDIYMINNNIIIKNKHKEPTLLLDRQIKRSLGDEYISSIYTIDNKIITYSNLSLKVYSAIGDYEKTYIKSQLCGNLILDLSTCNIVYPKLTILEDSEDIITFHPGDKTRLIAEKIDHTIIYNIETGKKEWSGYLGTKNRMWYDNYIITKSDDKYRVIDFITKKLHFTFDDNVFEIYIIPFGQGGGFITTDHDGILRVWK